MVVLRLLVVLMVLRVRSRGRAQTKSRVAPGWSIHHHVATVSVSVGVSVSLSLSIPVSLAVALRPLVVASERRSLQHRGSEVVTHCVVAICPLAGLSFAGVVAASCRGVAGALVRMSNP